MDFEPSQKSRDLCARLTRFMERYVLPYNAAWHAAVQAGQFPPAFMEDLKTLAREEGLWNLFLPALQTDADGIALSNLDYAPLAEIMGRIPWAAEVFNCNAPDSGNMELLQRFATQEQRAAWLTPLLAGTMRSAFAMSEPDVASSDPTGLQTSVCQMDGMLVLNGRKWFTTGAAHPNCKLLIVMCRNLSDVAVTEAGASVTDKHHRHSMVLVPIDTPGVQLIRNIPVVHHTAPEGHCEIVLRDVRVPLGNLLGAWGLGFAMAQARLGPGRIHHCMRTIGQCELALELAADRALERVAFGRHLSEYSNVQNWIAESRMEIDQARLMVLYAAWSLDRNVAPATQLQARISAIKVIAAGLQSRVVERAMQIFGAMGVSPDTPLAQFWTWGRAMHLMDGPDEVHLRTIARHEFNAARSRMGASSAYFTTPEQLKTPPRIR